jgi:hypothetical protein
MVAVRRDSVMIVKSAIIPAPREALPGIPCLASGGGGVH